MLPATALADDAVSAASIASGNAPNFGTAGTADPPSSNQAARPYVTLSGRQVRPCHDLSFMYHAS